MKTLITPSMIGKELLRLTYQKEAEVVYFYDTMQDGMRMKWWCNGVELDLGIFMKSDLEEGIDWLSRKRLDTAAELYLDEFKMAAGFLMSPSERFKMRDDIKIVKI